MPNEEGPLKEKLINENIEIIEMPVLKLKRNMLKTLRFIPLIREYRIAKRTLETKLNGRSIYCIHSNTLATLFGSFYCFRRPIPHIIHVHEIMERPKIIRYFFSLIQLFFAQKIVYNSKATESFYLKTMPTLKKKAFLIYNGVIRNTTFLDKDEVVKKRKVLFNANENNQLIGLIGRFNRLKGHKLLIEAFKKIQLKIPNTKLCFVGSPPEGQEHFLFDILNVIEDEKIGELVIVLPFQEDVYGIIDLLDIVAVPSTEPESYGIIAVEGMLSKKAVVASNLGGLADVISHNETGLLVEPNNEVELSNAILKLLLNESFKKEIEEKAFLTAKEKFSSASMTKQFIKLYSLVSK
jgi:glycosyltransferase involved in cell wall biosynthesis